MKNVIRFDALHWVEFRDRKDEAHMLLQINTIDVNSTDILGWNPLMWVAFVGSRNIVVILLEKEEIYADKKAIFTTIQNKVCTGCLIVSIYPITS